MIKQNDNFTDDILEDRTVHRMELWDGKIDRLDDEMIVYIIQKASNVLTNRYNNRNLKQFNKENQL